MRNPPVFLLPRTPRPIFHLPSPGPTRIAKRSTPSPTLIICLLVPFLLAALRAASLRGQLAKRSGLQSVDDKLVPVRGAPPLHVFGLSTRISGAVVEVADTPTKIRKRRAKLSHHVRLDRKEKNSKELSLRESNVARRERIIFINMKHERELKGVPAVPVAPAQSVRRIFVPEDVNNPTKVPVPEDGFPPLDLPPRHPRRNQLQKIRASCHMTPRWPKHPGMHATELRSFGPAYSSIIISEKLKVIYVPVFKVGTTSMMWHIAYLENNPYVIGQDTSRPGRKDALLHEMSGPGWINHTIYRKSEEKIRAYFEDPSYLKFGFVRNPFDRIISAYLDKIIKHPIVSKEYQKQMYGLYGRDPDIRRLRNESKPSFREYLEAVEVVLNQPRTSTSDLWNRHAFEDNTSRRDLHWRPQVELLHPDLVHFDFVGRFEQLEEDRKVVLDWIYEHTERRMPETYEKKLHATDPKDKVQLYEHLRSDLDLRDLVIRIYKTDFERFQFSTEVPSTRI